METERLILRPVSLEDTQSLFEYASNIENTTHVFQHICLKMKQEKSLQSIIYNPVRNTVLY